MTQAVIFGFGALGRALMRAIELTGKFEIVSVVDTAPDYQGKPVSELLAGSRSQVKVSPHLPDRTGAAPSILFHATTSAPQTATAQILAAIDAGYSVVSAAEWLFHPWLRYQREADALDAAARRAGTSVLGCGVNPGFCFETLPILLSHTLAEVHSLKIKRISNVGGVGPADFAHLGFGLSAAAFGAGVEAGAIDGHMGFPESVAALAECTGISIDGITDHLLPTSGIRPIVLSHQTVEVGETVGITQVATGWNAGKPVIEMTLEMFLDPEAYGRSPQEHIEVIGSRSFTLALKPAAPPGDGAAAMMLHAAMALTHCPAGLINLLDLPMSYGRLSRALIAGPARRSPEGSSFAVASARQSSS